MCAGYIIMNNNQTISLLYINKYMTQLRGFVEFPDVSSRIQNTGGK